MLFYFILSYLILSYCNVVYYITDREPSPQDRFLDHIDDDEARAIVRRCLVPSDRIQIRAVLGKGTTITASRFVQFVQLCRLPLIQLFSEQCCRSENRTMPL